LICILCHLAALTGVLAMGVELFYGALVSGIDDIRPRQEMVYSKSGESPEGKPPVEFYDVVTARNLFGSVDEAAVPEETGEEQFKGIEPTTLSVSLLGTVAGGEDGGYAVIEESAGRKQGLFRVGESIQDAVLKRIRRGEVILHVGGKYEKLTMDEAAKARSDSGGSAAGSVATTGGRIPVSRGMIESSLANINQIMTQVRVRPHFSGGVPDGLAVSHIRPNSIFSRLGFENGDVVKGVDGRAIKSPEDIFNFYNRLKSGSDISVDVLRRGRTQTLKYSFK
jgi:general secretion pathway protein C